jgi:hypothetical protein
LGDRYRVRHGERAGVKTDAGYLTFAVNGCQKIIEEDPRTTGGEMWKGLCNTCLHSKARRTQGRDLNRRVKAKRLGNEEPST